MADEYSHALVRCTTAANRFLNNSTAGSFTIALNATLSGPLGVERFLRLVDEGFFDDQLLYRVAPGRLVQWGVAADPSVQQRWSRATFADEPNRLPFRRGTLSFAGNLGGDSRTTHVGAPLRKGVEQRVGSRLAVRAAHCALRC